ncbi:ABC transporter permease [Bombilactobacillus bombi]|uniref:Putative hemin transport system permease protein HrtB n=1 Tax=Bombilactobacillus bombi TaxID=1303590 RepID=A0A3R6ZE15_9LACO|nr:ABC transporter permease [Bombilactobacillus bombi]RHW51818.1 ABC transporter permease [Bombilactobacillus bombi]
MYLAIKEMKHNKFRYGLIIMMIMLISYLIFILTSLATGLAESNRQAIDSWQAEAIVLNADADGSLRKASLTTSQVQKITKNKGPASVIGELSVTASQKKLQHKAAAELLGINKSQFIYHDLKVIAGRNFKRNFEAVVDQSLADKGYQLGDDITVAANTPKIKIVGFTKNAQLSVAPVIYTSLATWQQIKYGGAPIANSSAVVFKNNFSDKLNADTEKLTMAQFIQKLPGYQAQNLTFEFMIGFLLIITLIIIAIFLYILTIQKLPIFAVLKAQGIPTRYLIKNTVMQAFLITIIGLILGVILAAITKLMLPKAVPMSFNYQLLFGATVALLIMSLLGSLIPTRTIKKVDPAAMIGGN